LSNNHIQQLYRSQHGKNLIGTVGIELFTKSHILRRYDVLARHSDKQAHRWAAEHLFNRTNGGLLPLPLLHATVNTVGAGYVFPMFSGVQNTRLWWIYSLLWVIAAVASVLASPTMTQKPSAMSV
jgi:hypothetical protein